MNRSEILQEAARLISGDRADDYGDAKRNFLDIAALWSSYLDEDITVVDVANMMMLMKIARTKKSPGKADSWVDICGYSALIGEIKTHGTE